MTTRTMLVMKMMLLPLPKWKPTKMGMTDALEGCRKFSSRTKARGLSGAATASRGIEPIHGRTNSPNANPEF